MFTYTRWLFHHHLHGLAAYLHDGDVAVAELCTDVCCSCCGLARTYQLACNVIDGYRRTFGCSRDAHHLSVCLNQYRPSLDALHGSSSRVIRYRGLHINPTERGCGCFGVGIASLRGIDADVIGNAELHLAAGICPDVCVCDCRNALGSLCGAAEGQFSVTVADGGLGTLLWLWGRVAAPVPSSMKRKSFHPLVSLYLLVVRTGTYSVAL